MPNIASLLKSEISRVARKEVRTEIAALKKASTIYRAEIAALKRRAQGLEQELRRLGKAKGPQDTAGSTDAPSASKQRFSAKGLASQRKRLGLSANDCGRLIGASSQSVYNWEAGSAQPRAKHMEAIAALRTMGKKEAKGRLAAAL
jgi:DNA-binding transcriptional regulator YiaG